MFRKLVPKQVNAPSIQMHRTLSIEKMEAAPVTSRLRLQNPPVVETALQIQFIDIPHWSTIAHGLYYPIIRNEFPRFTHLPELSPIVETFPPNKRRMQLEFSVKQDAGCAQFESKNADKLIRVQRNRFAYHWLGKIDNAPPTAYTSYDSNLEICLSQYELLKSFCVENSLGNLTPVLCEVMYLNHIMPIQGENLEQMVEQIFGTKIGSFEMFTLNRTFAMEEKGRLYTEINTSFDDGNPFVTFQLTSRVNHFEGSIRDTLDVAHKWLIEVFCNLTDPLVRKDRWKEIG